MKKTTRISAYLQQLRHLPSTLYTIRNDISNVSRATSKSRADLEVKLRETRQEVETFAGVVEDIRTSYRAININIGRLESMVNQMANTKSTSRPAATEAQPSAGQSGKLFAENSTVDAFYKAFEDKFRGSEEAVKEKLQYCLPYFKQVKDRQQVVLDIGCGRGELLELLKERGIHAVGIDLNKEMVDRVKAKGLDAELADANVYLRNKKKLKKIGAITGFHIVEHIPFNQLLELFRSCYTALEPGGFVIFETPNPESLLVGTNNFYTDPSHLHPIPPSTLQFALETTGFVRTKINRLRPFKEVKTSHLDPLVEEVVRRYFTNREYSVVAYKPNI